MEKTILTPAQHNFLQLAQTENAITDWFFLTGGTALSEFYLHHRLSEDLDFFSTSEINTLQIEKIIRKFIVEYKATRFTRRQLMGLYVYQIFFKTGKSLKIDFNHFVFDQLEAGRKVKNLKIASLWDITIDKLYTILTNPRGRDYIDLYFAVKEQDCNMDQLISALREKYEFEIDNINMLSQFVRVKDFSDIPKLLVKFKKKEIEEFFLKMADHLEAKIFK